MYLSLDNPAHPGHSNYLISTQGKKAVRVWYPDLPIIESVREELIEECNTHINERCGFISVDWEVWNVANSHEFPRQNYYMRKEDVESIVHEVYDFRKSRIIAVWHTHPDNVPWPSPRDIRGWPNPALEWRYLIITNNDIFEWELVDSD